jgi:predicted ArsR family transcriptional regulator
VPDSRRLPVRPGTLAERLGITHETVRRHLGRLVADDRCERNEHGYVVPARILARPGFVQYMTDNRSHLHRLYAQLSDYGVLSEWERQVQALRGAA